MLNNILLYIYDKLGHFLLRLSCRIFSIGEKYGRKALVIALKQRKLTKGGLV